jgi:hypothetical protein
MSTNSIRVAIRVAILASLLFTFVVVALPSQASAGYTCDMCSPMARWCRYQCEEYGLDSQECTDCEAAVDDCFATCTP